MWLIEKALTAGLNAVYIESEAYKWIPAWSGSKSYLESSLDEAIHTFKERTSKVRKVSYRLINLNERVTVAAINTPDAQYFERYATYSVGISDGPAAVQKVREYEGGLVPDSGCILVGTSRTKTSKVDRNVDRISELLSSVISSHSLTKRFNSDGKSGGVFLVTSPTDGLMSNSDIGISYSEARGDFSLMVDSKYLRDKSLGNSKSVWSDEMDFRGNFKHVSEAISTLRSVVRIATEADMAIFRH